MSLALRLSPFLLAAGLVAPGCTIAEADRPVRVEGIPSVAVSHAVGEMADEVQPGLFLARIGALPIASEGHEESEGEEAEHEMDAAHDDRLHGTARLDTTQGGHLVYLDADGFAVRIEVMLPETAFANRVPDGDADVPAAPAPTAGGLDANAVSADGADVGPMDAAGPGVDPVEARAEQRAALADEDAGITVLQTYAGKSRLRATVIVDGRRMDSQSGELHLRTVQDGRLRGWFYFDAKPLAADALENETERVYGAFDAVMAPDVAAVSMR